MTDNDPNVIHVVSVSGGKDSTALLCLALSQVPRRLIRAVFADTGHEHPLTYAYLDYLERKLNFPIRRLRANFDKALAGKRAFIEANWRADGVPEEKVQRALTVLQPTGVPFLDLCLWKGRFPARRSQFCTKYLKTDLLNAYAYGLLDETWSVWSWQGVRADESSNRRDLPVFETLEQGFCINRPILTWTAEQVLSFARVSGVEPNPLYKQGMRRVGCMPCINSSKGDVSEVARRWPEVIDRIEQWEALVSDACKRGNASFFAAPNDGRGDKRGRDIRAYVRWSRTRFGGREADPEKLAPPPACVSSYGLCE